MSGTGLTPKSLAGRGIFTTHIAISASAILAAVNTVESAICGHPVDIVSFVTNPENDLLWLTAAIDWITRHAGIGTNTAIATPTS